MGKAPRRLTFRGIVFIILYIPFEPCAPCLLYGRLAPCRAFAVIRRLVGGGSAALPCRPGVGVPCSVVRSYNNTQSRACKYLKRIKTTKITQLIIFVTIAHITIYFGGLALSTINNYDNAIIAEKIKKECARQNITLKTMLQELNISINAIQQMRKNDKTPNYKYIARICDYLNISIDTLLDRAAPTNADNAPPISIGQAVRVIADYLHTSPDYVCGVLRLPPTRSSTDNDV